MRRIAGMRRVGHAGTLDPQASGLLVLGLGPATRLLEYLLVLPKSYDAQLRLGQETTTFDAEGEIVAERQCEVDRETFDAALATFRGSQEQIPPRYAAIKQGGEPLYKRARRGEEVHLIPRPIVIYELTLTGWRPPFAELHVRCSAGTYIRSLAHDLGAQLGCGAYLSGLRRTAVGHFDIAAAWAPDRLQPDTLDQAILPPDNAVTHLPALQLDAEEARRLRLGQRLPHTPGQPEAPLVRVYDADGNFVGLAAGGDGRWQPRKILPL